MTDPSREERALPCPCCESDDLTIVPSCDFIACNDCGISIEDGEPNALTVWNRRPVGEIQKQDESGYDPHGPEVTALHFWFADNGQQWKWHDDGCRSEQARDLLNHLAKSGLIVVKAPTSVERS